MNVKLFMLSTSFGLDTASSMGETGQDEEAAHMGS